MSRLQKYYPFFASALLMWIVLWLIYPHYQYYIDPDGTAYLTISKRYAGGDIQRAINGYWSPWACWLTAGLIKLGLQAIPASVIINTLGATGFLYISQSFFQRFGLVRKMQWMLNITLAFFLCYAIFWQSFDDLWECFFLLGALRLMLIEEFKNRPALWVIMGVIGALAYFAKAYSFPFFILNTICCAWFIAKGNKIQWLKISFVAVGIMVLCGLPWIVALHHKYGIWTTSTSGTLNMSWYLVGHPHWKPGIDVLIPPAYPDSPYYWEDPWFANGDTPHFWDSWHLFGLQILRLGYNLYKLLRSMLEICLFFPVVSVVALFSLSSKKLAAIFNDDKRILVLSFLLFPVGYLLINFESRYIWYTVPLGMVIGSSLLNSIGENGFKRLLPVIFSIGFLIYPAWRMMLMYNVGQIEYRTALQLKNQGVKGLFTAYPLRGSIAQQMERIAYFSGMQYYSIPPPDSCSLKDVIFEMDRYRVNYLFKAGYYFNIKLPNGRMLTNVTSDKIYDYSYFIVNP